jgi:hypothetical protein
MGSDENGEARTAVNMWRIDSARLRLSKVITHLPLVPDAPIEFGVAEFCASCKKCADRCPSRSIPSGDMTAEPINVSPRLNSVSVAWCMEETLTCGFTRERFEKLVLDHPRIGLQVMRNLSSRISSLTNRIESHFSAFHFLLFSVNCIVFV